MLRRLIDRIYGKQDERQAPSPPPAEEASPEPAATGHGQEPPRGGETPDPVPPDGSEAHAHPASSEGEAPDAQAVRARVIENLKKVYDPEIPVDIYELGLIYEVRPEANGMVYVKMTLTAPNCPAAGILPGQVESQVRATEGVHDVKLDLVFDPPWTPERMSEAARLELGMM